MSLLKKLKLLRIDGLTDVALSRYIEAIQDRRTVARREAKFRKIRVLKPTSKAKHAKKKAVGRASSDQ